MVAFDWKVTVCLASHWPCVTDFSVLSTYGLTRGRWASCIHSSEEYRTTLPLL